MPRDAIEDWLSILENKASERGIALDTDIDGRIFHFLLGEDDPVLGKVRTSSASNRNFTNERGETHIWQRFDREQEHLTENPNERICSIQLDIEESGSFDPETDHFLFIPGELILQETYSEGDQKIHITNDGGYRGELARYADDWEALFEYAIGELSISDLDEERVQTKLDELQADEDDGEDTELSQYWRTMEQKRQNAKEFLETSTRENLESFLEDFWTMRAAPKAEWYLDDEVLVNRSADEVASTFEEAATTESISVALELDGFGVSRASEALHAIAPDKFAIFNDKSQDAVESLGYDERDTDRATASEYEEFLQDVVDLADRLPLLEIAENVSDDPIPEWATELDIADYLFNLNSEGNIDIQTITSQYAGYIETAPYYWVNQTNNPEELEEEYLQAPMDRSFGHDIARLEEDDIVFHFTEGNIVGYSEVAETAKPIDVEGEEENYWQVGVDLEYFDEPLRLAEIFEYLFKDDVKLDQYYPINYAGVNQGYLFNLSEKAGDYLLEQAGIGGNQQWIEDDFELERVDIELPDGLYFPGGESARLRNQINAALNSGKHLIFTGPPGTGKSKLAKHVAEEVEDQTSVDDYVFSTATAEWSTFDTIGGYVPSTETNELNFDPRLFLECFRDDEGNVQNNWLVIDELNRANIDKALGPLFSVLSEDSVQLPYEREERIQIDWVDDSTDDAKLKAISESEDRFPVTPSWRILGTMNTFDKTSLYELSFAFMRRFSFIHVGVPEQTTDEGIPERTLLDPDEGPNYATVWQREFDDLEETIQNYHEELSVLWAILNEHRSIGPSIVLDMIQHIEAYEGGERTEPLTSALVSLVFPQLEGMREPDQKNLLADLESGGEIRTKSGDTDRIDLRIDTEYLWRKAEDIYELDRDE